MLLSVTLSWWNPTQVLKDFCGKSAEMQFRQTRINGRWLYGENKKPASYTNISISIWDTSISTNFPVLTNILSDTPMIQYLSLILTSLKCRSRHHRNHAIFIYYILFHSVKLLILHKNYIIYLIWLSLWNILTLLTPFVIFATEARCVLLKAY